MAKLSERDVCTKFITPALVAAGWDLHTQVREELSFTKGRIIVRGRLVTRGKAKRADYVLYYKHLALAVIEAKDQSHVVGAGMQQALDYATILDIPYVFASNGSGFQFHDRTGTSTPVEQTLARTDNGRRGSFPCARRSMVFYVPRAPAISSGCRCCHARRGGADSTSASLCWRSPA